MRKRGGSNRQGRGLALPATSSDPSCQIVSSPWPRGIGLILVSPQDSSQARNGQPLLSAISYGFGGHPAADRDHCLEYVNRFPNFDGNEDLADTRPQPARTIPNNRFHDSAVPLIRAGSRYGFLLSFDLERNPDAHLAAQFTDDA
jgi:hypothetical protein